MKTYPYNFTKTVKILLYVLCVICVACIGFTVYRCVNMVLLGASPDFYTILKTFIPAIVAVLGLIIAISMLRKSCYEIKDRHMITRFGVISSRFEIPDIVEIHFFTKTRKLTLYFKNNRYIVISVKEEWYRDFIAELLKRNKSISYSETETDED